MNPSNLVLPNLSGETSNINNDIISDIKNGYSLNHIKLYSIEKNLPIELNKETCEVTNGIDVKLITTYEKLYLFQKIIKSHSSNQNKIVRANFLKSSYFEVLQG